MIDLLLYVLYLIIGLLATGVVLLIHELGHYIAAKILGAEVEVFGIGTVLLFGAIGVKKQSSAYL